MRRRPGTTVIELLFGLAVLALVASIGTGTLYVLGGSRSESRDALDTVRRDAALRRTIVEWLEGAHGTLGATSGAFQLVDATHLGHNSDILTFTTTAHTSLGTPETTIRLYIDDDRRTPESGLTAELASWPGGPVQRIELDSAVTTLDVRCLTSLIGDRQWVSSWTSTSLLPRAVRLQLGGAPNHPIAPLLKLPIVVAVEGGR